jgi:hypothetical protein
MWMRLLPFSLGLWLLSQTAFATPTCAYVSTAEFPLTALGADNSHPQFEPESTDVSDYSSFRGLSLAMTEAEAAQALKRLRLTMVAQSSTRNAMDICRGKKNIGTIRFDENRRIEKLQLGPLYFLVGRIVLREFADDVFKRFDVHPSVSDNICYWDVTCFKGTTSLEEFLILRITDDVQLHVSKKRNTTNFTHRQ